MSSESGFALPLTATAANVFPSIAGHVVIVTGAGQGIGRAFAHALAAAGAHPVIAERNAATGAKVAAEINEAGGRALFVEADVGNPSSVEAMAAATLSGFGRIDALINNAAIFSTLEMRTFDQIPLDEWELVMRVNVTGPYLCAKAVVGTMREAKRGRIVNIASGAVTLGRPNYTHYTASKGAMIAMTRSMARELGPDGITVNTILPGATFTEVERKTVTPLQKERILALQCIPRHETPDDLVGTMLFLVSDASAFITGQSITVDGGATHL